MSYLLWAIFNVILGISFLYFLYRLIKVIYKNFGGLAAFLIGLAVLALFNHIKPEPNGKALAQTYTAPDSVRYFRHEYEILLEKNIVFNIHLQLSSLNDKNRNDERQANSVSFMSGFSSYNTWNAKDILIQNSGDIFTYTVVGELTWRILKHTVYRQQKTYTGQIKKI